MMPLAVRPPISPRIVQPLPAPTAESSRRQRRFIVSVTKRRRLPLAQSAGPISGTALRLPHRLEPSRATIDRRERLWARGGESRPAHLRNFPKKNWKRACLPTSRHPGEPIGTGVAIAVRILATGHLAECPLLGRTGHARMAGMT